MAPASTWYVCVLRCCHLRFRRSAEFGQSVGVRGSAVSCAPVAVDIAVNYCRQTLRRSHRKQIRWDRRLGHCEDAVVDSASIPNAAIKSLADTWFTSSSCDASPRYSEVKTDITGLNSNDKKMLVFELVTFAAVDLNTSRWANEGVRIRHRPLTGRTRMVPSDFERTHSVGRSVFLARPGVINSQPSQFWSLAEGRIARGSSWNHR